MAQNELASEHNQIRHITFPDGSFVHVISISNISE